ncbi:serine hydrolase domain-containing protein [Pseudoalteromonas luteoviolacea]|uniref:serine hydrolase domain-containing protein n=1 Tax=Pseudoalteromonas luteoviolacea TaxID=43657 RepID=UPI00068CC782|nr:serine hydrolase domain-containing protein [Pseudoalteromonas luteoviolacea]
MKATTEFRSVILAVLFGFLVACFFVSHSIHANLASERHGQKVVIDASMSKIELTGLEQYVEALIERGIAQHTIPGVTVSIVKDDKIVMLKGYGFSDVSSQKMVNPHTTLFRIGSITKTMTAIAVMQLVEQGKLALDVDINEYLTEFKIPDTFEDPITIAALLSHRAGFEEADAGNLLSGHAEEVLSTSQYLATYMPSRVWPVGYNMSYSNYGFGLLGYLVELKSGLDLATYMEQHIFSPLGMHNTTLREPLGSEATSMQRALQAHLATGYFKDTAGRNLAKPFEFIGHIGGAGAVSATAENMALYMRSLLQERRGLVSPLTDSIMKQRLYDDRVLATGVAHGMFEGNIRGYKYYHHSGATLTFSANMIVFPEIQLGIFIASNMVGGAAQLADFLPRAILNKYYKSLPIQIDESPQLGAYNQFMTAPIVKRQLEEYTGSWLSTRRSYTQLEKVSALDSSVIISLDAQGQLVMRRLGSHTKFALKRLKENVFQAQSDQGSIFYFYPDSSGEITRFSASMWSGDYERVSLFHSPFFFYFVLILASLLSLSTLLLTSLQKRRAKTLHVFKKVTRIVAGLLLLTVIGFIFMNSGLVLDEYNFLINFPTLEVKLLLYLVLVIALLTLVKVVGLAYIWRHEESGMLYKIHYSMFTLSCFSFLYVFWVWNAIGFNYVN